MKGWDSIVTFGKKDREAAIGPGIKFPMTVELKSGKLDDIVISLPPLNKRKNFNRRFPLSDCYSTGFEKGGKNTTNQYESGDKAGSGNRRKAGIAQRGIR